PDRAAASATAKKEPRRITAPRRCSGLATQAEFLDQGPVARSVLAVQVVEQAAAAVDHHQQAAPAVVVLLVRLEVFGQVHDACGEQGHLHFRRAGVVGGARVFLDDLVVVDGHDCLWSRNPQITSPHCAAGAYRKGSSCGWWESWNRLPVLDGSAVGSA